MIPRKKVSLFIPCLIDQFYPEIGFDTIFVLEQAGIQVSYPMEQTCCGQPAYNTGYRKEAAAVAEHFIEVFSDSGTIVCPSGSCVSMVRNHYRFLSVSPKAAERLVDLENNIFEITEFIQKEGLDKGLRGRFPFRVAFHDSCHSMRELGTKVSTENIIERIEDIEVITGLERADDCCGFGGTFAVKFPEISTSMAAEKIEIYVQQGIEYFVTNDISCLMQLNGIVRKKKLSIKPIHLISLLARSLENEILFQNYENAGFNEKNTSIS